MGISGLVFCETDNETLTSCPNFFVFGNSHTIKDTRLQSVGKSYFKEDKISNKGVFWLTSRE